jgi:AmmeMemoRadiSam system protein B
MTLIGCFVTPHPPIIVPEVGGAQLAEAYATVQAMRAVREKAAAFAPDTIVLLSPHASTAVHTMGVSLASEYSGSLAFFRAPHVSLTASGDQELAEAIAETAASNGVPTNIIASREEAVDLDHGAIVPLVYLMGGLEQPCRLVLLAFSQLGYREHVRFGEAVGKAIMGAPQRVLYVASSDLSHRLIPGAPVGFDPRGERFDRMVVDTFGAGDWNGLLSINPGLVAAAGECGYRSLAVLAGVVQAARAAGLRSQNRVLSYEGPFGVGYLVGEVEMAEVSQMQRAAQ